MSEPTQQAIPMSARSARPLAGRLSIAIAGAALTLVAAAMAPDSAQTLTEALSYAYNSNPQLLAQRSLLRQTDESVPQALSNWRPTVTFTGQAGIDRGSVNTGNGDQFSTFKTRQLDLLALGYVELAAGRDPAPNEFHLRFSQRLIGRGRRH